MQSGNQERVLVLECISADEVLLLPTIIFPARHIKMLNTLSIFQQDSNKAERLLGTQAMSIQLIG